MMTVRLITFFYKYMQDFNHRIYQNFISVDNVLKLAYNSAKDFGYWICWGMQLWAMLNHGLSQHPLFQCC